MRPLILLMIMLTFLLPPLDAPAVTALHSTMPLHREQSSYVLVGGQNGTWFKPGQHPKLYRILLSNYSVTQLTPVPSEGTVWTGGWNGSQWLISGWGTDFGPHGSNPYIYLYDGKAQVTAGSLNQYEAESSWHGGDIFAASYNGKYWLLSGLGSDSMPSSYSGKPWNHMSLATFDGYNFIDLSSKVPKQRDAILYANAWNGTHWLVGGGYGTVGVLFTFDGTTILDLTARVSRTVRAFGSVQSIAWNGKYWLIGGIGFLVKYDGYSFVDLTSQLRAGLSAHLANAAFVMSALSNGSRSVHQSQPTVNAIVWNGSSWMLGGGSPVAQVTRNVAWIVSYSAQNGFVDLSSSLPSYVSKPNRSGSSILSICHAGKTWVFAGYSDGHAILFSYTNGVFVDISSFVSSMRYAIWVGAQTSYQPSVDDSAHST